MAERVKQVNMHEAKTHLSTLVNQEFIIARAGKPVARVTPITTTPVSRRFGWMPSDQPVPDDFDSLGDIEILEMFGPDERTTTTSE